MGVLKPEFKAAWVAALRSGKYEQGVGGLKYQTKSGALWCCLGVGCDVLGAPAVNRVGDQDGIDPDWPLNEVWHDGADNKEVRYDLARRNDEGETFEQIADYIEREL